jgi:transcriptional regulator with XRE-family HTH domain
MTQSAKRRHESEVEPVRVLGRGLRAARGVHLTLRTLRDAVGKTQIDIARQSQIDQADISRLEARSNFEDCQVATLRRYVEALGGSLELVAQFGEKRIAIAGIQKQPVAKPANKALQQTGLSRRLRRRSGARS